MSAKPYTPEMIAERWGVSARSVRNLCKNGVIGSFRVGTAYRIPAESLAAYEGVKQCELNAEPMGTGTPSIQIMGLSALEPKTESKPSSEPPTSNERPKVIAWRQ